MTIFATLQRSLEPPSHLDLSPAVADRVRLTNAVALLTTCTTLMGTPLFALLDIRAGAVEATFAIGCFGAFVLNRAGLYNLSRIWLPFLIASGLGIFTVAFGEGAGLAFGFIIPMLMVSWLHTQEERLQMLGAQALLIVLQVGSLAAASQIAPLVPLTESLAAAFRAPLSVVMNVAAGGVAFGFAIVFHNNERRLEAVNSRLLMEVEQHLETAEQLRVTANLTTAAARAKTDFLANMTHELRTPLSAIVSLTTFALEAPLPSGVRSDIQDATSAANRALSVIDNIMDVSRGANRKLVLTSSPYSIEEIVALVADEAHRHAAQKGSSFHLETSNCLGVRMVDGPRLQQILRNLLQNAIHFASQGGATLRVSLPRDNLMKFEVLDDGIGMTPMQLEHVFEPFYQAQQSANRTHQGAGLGASLASQLVGLMGSVLQVESEPNVQTRFWFEVRLPPAPVPQSPIEPQVFRILAAEDDRVNQMIVRRMVTAAGHECTVVEDGLEAVRACQSQAWSLILMDMQMPRMDGLEATRTLRNNGYQGAIVALTANTLDQDRDRCLAAGMDGFVTKPLTKAALLTALSEYARAAPVLAAAI